MRAIFSSKIKERNNKFFNDGHDGAPTVTARAVVQLKIEIKREGGRRVGREKENEERKSAGKKGKE